MYIRLLAYLIELLGSIMFLWPVNAIQWWMAVRNQSGWRKGVLCISALCGIASGSSFVMTVMLLVTQHGEISPARFRLLMVAMGLYMISFLAHMNPLDYFMKHLAPRRHSLAEVLLDLRWKHSPFRHKEIMA